MQKQCPKCDRWQTEDAWLCECGHEFDPAAKHEVRETVSSERSSICTALAYIVPIGGYFVVSNRALLGEPGWGAAGRYFFGLLLLIVLSVVFSLLALVRREPGGYAVFPVLVLAGLALLYVGGVMLLGRL